MTAFGIEYRSGLGRAAFNVQAWPCSRSLSGSKSKTGPPLRTAFHSHVLVKDPKLPADDRQPRRTSCSNTWRRLIGFVDCSKAQSCRTVGGQGGEAVQSLGELWKCESWVFSYEGDLKWTGQHRSKDTILERGICYLEQWTDRHVNVVQPEHSFGQQNSVLCINALTNSLFLQLVQILHSTFESVNRLGEGICDFVDDSPTTSREALFIWSFTEGATRGRVLSEWAVVSGAGLMRAKQFTRQSNVFYASQRVFVLWGVKTIEAHKKITWRDVIKTEASCVRSQESIWVVCSQVGTILQ